MPIQQKVRCVGLCPLEDFNMSMCHTIYLLLTRVRSRLKTSVAERT